MKNYLLLMLLTCGYIANAQEWINYTVSNTSTSICGNEVEDIKFDPNGSVWFVTPNGISNFNGSSWVSYTNEKVSYNQFNFNYCKLAIGDDGKKWLISRAVFNNNKFKLAKLEGSDITTYSFNEILNRDNGYAICLAVDKSNNIWIGTNCGILRFDGKTWTKYNAEHGLKDTVIRTITVDADNGKWFGTANGGAMMFDGVSWVNYSKDDGLPDNYVSSIVIDNKANRWFRTPEGVSKFDGEYWTNYPIYGSIAKDINDDVFVANGNGVFKFDGIEWIKQTEIIEQIANDIKTFSIDSKGDFWFGSSTGAWHFDGTNWDNIRGNGLYSNHIGFGGGIAVDKTNGLWVLSAGEMLQNFNGNTWTNYPGNQEVTYQNLAADKNGDIWVTFHKNGKNYIQKFNGESWEILSANITSEKEFVSIMKFDQHNNFWVAYYGDGIAKYDGNSFTYFNVQNGLIGDYVNSLTFDKEGNIWIVARGGVQKFDGANWTTYTVSDGLITDWGWDIACDSAGNIWVASEYEGMSMFDGTSWTAFTDAEIGGSPRIMAVDFNGYLRFAGLGFGGYSIVVKYEYWFEEEYNIGDLCEVLIIDRNGTLWAGTSGNGIFKLELEPTNVVSAKETSDSHLIWPNPCRNEIKVNLPTSELYSISIYDLNGREVKRANGLSGNSAVVGANDLLNGVYLYNLKSDRNKLYSGKVVILK